MDMSILLLRRRYWGRRARCKVRYGFALACPDSDLPRTGCLGRRDPVALIRPRTHIERPFNQHRKCIEPVSKGHPNRNEPAFNFTASSRQSGTMGDNV